MGGAKLLVFGRLMGNTLKCDLRSNHRDGKLILDFFSGVNNTTSTDNVEAEDEVARRNIARLKSECKLNRLAVDFPE